MPIRATRSLLATLTLALSMAGWVHAEQLPRETQPSQPSTTASTRQELLKELREKQKETLTPYVTAKGEDRARKWETRQPKLLTKGYGGFRALIGGIDDPVRFGKASSGAGLAGGIGYQNGTDRREFRFRADARISTKRYQLLEAVAEFPTPNSTSPIQAFVAAAYRDYKEINFFGLEDITSAEDEATFRLQDRRVGVGVNFQPNKLFFLEAGWSFLNTHVLRGTDDSSIQEIFDLQSSGDLGVIGNASPPEYHIFGTTAGVNLFDRGFPEAGAGFLVSVERYDDRRGDRFDFTRITGEFSSEIPLGTRNRRIAFRLRTVHHLPDAGKQVPFYLQETLGGGTTLRGFENYRFRGRRSLLMNLEYRWEVWTYADFALFADAGKAFQKAGDLDLTNLEASYGFGVLVRAPFQDALGRYGRLRIDIAKSREGLRIHIGSGPEFGRRFPPQLR